MIVQDNDDGQLLPVAAPEQTRAELQGRFRASPTGPAIMHPAQPTRVTSAVCVPCAAAAANRSALVESQPASLYPVGSEYLLPFGQSLITNFGADASLSPLERTRRYYGYTPKILVARAEEAVAEAGEGGLPTTIGGLAGLPKSWFASANVFMTGVDRGTLTTWTVSLELIYDSRHLGGVASDAEFVAAFGYSFGLFRNRDARDIGKPLIRIDKRERWPATLNKTYQTTLIRDYYPSYFAIWIGILTFPGGGQLSFPGTGKVVAMSPWSGPRVEPNR